TASLKNAVLRGSALLLGLRKAGTHSRNSPGFPPANDSKAYASLRVAYWSVKRPCGSQSYAATTVLYGHSHTSRGSTLKACATVKSRSATSSSWPCPAFPLGRFPPPPRHRRGLSGRRGA